MTKRILSINENSSMSFILQTVLSSRYSLVAVSNVFHGMQKLKKGLYDLIIVDLDYQKSENLEFIKHIASSSLYKIPVYALLSELDEVVIHALSVDNISQYFLKPFSPIDLLTAIDKHNTILSTAS
jgi:CheY-like chemotaxis protein